MKCEKCEIEHDGSYGSGRFCSSKCARGFSTFKKRAEINKRVSENLTGRIVSDETREKISHNNLNRSQEVLDKISSTLKQTWLDNPELGQAQSDRMSNRIVSDETKMLMSKNAIERGFGGVTQSRWIKYKGKTLGSTYELQVAESLDENNIRWDMCPRFKYIDNNGKGRTYTPDLYLIDFDVYLEPKNDFLIENINPNLGFKDTDKIKWTEEQNNIRVILLNKDQLSWDYIKTKI